MWARVDDMWWSHPKVLGLSLAARGLWVTALSWSCGQRRDFVPEAFVGMLTGEASVTDELVRVGLWREAEGGWLIHDWATYQDLSLSEKRADAGRRGAQKRWQTGEDPPPETTSDLGEPAPSPDGKPMANKVAMPVAIDSKGYGKGDGRYPSHPIPDTPSNEGGAPTIFQALYEFWLGKRYEPGEAKRLTKGERGKLNAAAKQARDAGIAPAEIAERGTRYVRDWPGMERSPTGLLNHWTRFDASADPPAPFDPANCTHPEDRRAELDGQTYCGACGREMRPKEQT